MSLLSKLTWYLLGKCALLSLGSAAAHCGSQCEENHLTLVGGDYSLHEVGTVKGMVNNPSNTNNKK